MMMIQAKIFSRLRKLRRTRMRVSFAVTLTLFSSVHFQIYVRPPPDGLSLSSRRTNLNLQKHYDTVGAGIVHERVPMAKSGTRGWCTPVLIILQLAAFLFRKGLQYLLHTIFSRIESFTFSAAQTKNTPLKRKHPHWQ